jgi:hypothetical protein
MTHSKNGLAWDSCPGTIRSIPFPFLSFPYRSLPGGEPRGTAGNRGLALEEVKKKEQAAWAAYKREQRCLYCGGLHVWVVR